MHRDRLRCENTKYREYSFVFAPCRPRASTPKSVNLFLREPLAPKNASLCRDAVCLRTAGYLAVAAARRSARVPAACPEAPAAVNHVSTAWIVPSSDATHLPGGPGYQPGPRPGWPGRLSGLLQLRGSVTGEERRWKAVSLKGRWTRPSHGSPPWGTLFLIKSLALRRQSACPQWPPDPRFLAEKSCRNSHMRRT